MDIDFVMNAVKGLIEGSRREAVSKEVEEKNNGIVLHESPKARLLSPPYFSIKGDPILKLGETTYLTSRRMWNAYKPSVQLIKYFGLDETLLYEVFHYLPGAAILVERNGCFLLGIRSANLAGVHIGMVSIPAGLMDPNEEIFATAQRELLEETGLVGNISKVACGRNPDAPNVTFVCFIKNPKGKLTFTHEVEGKQFIWVDKELVLSWINEETSCSKTCAARIAKVFRTHDIEVSDNLQLAPDICEGIRHLTNSQY